ncbi:glycosyltransferase family 2 protein [Flavitalea sp.]|nr:glycosyltransferase [Flavitalea sp.]
MSIGSPHPFISICIPAYKHRDYVERLLTSLLAQTFTDFEVIITDDSPDESVSNLVTGYRSRLNLHYFKNTPALGTPENWNEAMRQAKGQWIKLIHDDDWLASDSSLQDYVDAINQNPNIDFFFTAYYNVKLNDGENPDLTKEATADEITGIPMHIHISRNNNGKNEMIEPALFRIKQLQQNPVTLLSKNIIGPPSVVIHRNDQKYFYDKNFKWLVDMDFYMRYLDNRVAVYIDKPLVNIGINEQQVTRSSSLVREVEIPEHFRILEKTGIQQLKNLLVYDAWWRLIRNLKIRDLNEIKEAGYTGKIPVAIINLIKFQQKFHYSILKFGPASKTLMFASYTHNKLTNSFRN